MSQKRTTSRADAKADKAQMPTKHAGSDNRCSFDQSESASEAVWDSPRRASRVGLRGGRNRQYTLAERLAARIIKRPNGCWEVQGYPLPKGYVQITQGRGLPVIAAHVAAWQLAHGRTVPKGLVIMHLCDNPRCANPAHLELGTHRQNILDSIRKGRYNVFGRQKLNADQVREIRALAASGLRQKDIAARFGIKRHSVSGIVNNKSWTHLDEAARPFVADSGLNNVEPVKTVLLPVYDLQDFAQVPDPPVQDDLRAGDILHGASHVSRQVHG